MNPRKICDNVFLLGAVDWDRRLFDSLIPLPDGTSYNAYLAKGSEKTVLLDTVDPSKTDILMEQLADVPRLDFIVAHHAEQDHSGSIPAVLQKYPEAKVIASDKCTGLLVDHLCIPVDRTIAVKDGETVNLGGKTLKFIYTPWVHWPETMVTHLVEDKMLFTCDFFGSHLATSDMYAVDTGRVYEAAKRYYAEIMMPFRVIIRKNIEKISSLTVDTIAPSHGPLYRTPSFIVDAYKDWASDTPKNVAVVPFISMHGSTLKMVERLTGALAVRQVETYRFDLASVDIGKLAIALVDAATIVIGTPTVHVGPHPVVVSAVMLANELRPKLKFASIVGSYGWATKAVDHLAGMIPNLKVEVIAPVVCKGYPRDIDMQALDNLAQTIAQKHAGLK